MTIGAGIFVLPAAAAAGLGAAAPVAYIVCAVLMALIVCCFAAAGSRVSLTGGLYAYVEVAFGPFVGFLAGVLYFLMATFAVASVASAFAGSVGVHLAAVRRRRRAAPCLIASLFAVPRGGERPRRQAGRPARRSGDSREAAAAGRPRRRRHLVRQPRVPALAGDAGGVGHRRNRDRADLRVRRRRDRAGAERRSPRPDAHRAARALPRARDHDDALSADSEGRAGAARAVDRDLCRRAARRSGPPRPRLRRAPAGPGRRRDLDVRLRGGDMLGSPRALFAFARDGILPAALARIHPRFHTPYMAIVRLRDASSRRWPRAAASRSSRSSRTSRR